MKAKVTFEDETGTKKVVLNITEENGVLNIKAFAVPMLEAKPAVDMELYEKLAGTLINQLTK